MKKLAMLLILISISVAANLRPNIDPLEGDVVVPKPEPYRYNLIATCGDIRAILGPQGKSIEVCQQGDNVAVVYGGATGNSQNPMIVRVAYSLNSGTSWTLYGPFSGALRRIYPAIDGTPFFSTNAGELFFTWQESPYGYNQGDCKMMIEENVPSAPSFSSPVSLPNASSLFPWMPSISVAPDNPAHLVVTAWSYLNGGDGKLYAWVSEDGGYSWSNPIELVQIAPLDSGGAGHVRQGTNGYVALTYHNGNNGFEWPYLIESTDGGYTWLNPIPLPATTAQQFWWHEFDLEVINNQPWSVHNDLGTGIMWLFYPSGGGPGNWTWNVRDVKVLGRDSLWKADTLFQTFPSQYPSVCYEPTTGTVLITYKGFYYRGDNATWATHNGAHVGGIYTTDGGNTWRIAWPLSDPNPNTIVWSDWNATETAHLLPYINNQIWAYSVWINATTLNCYFEKGYLRSWPATGIEESDGDYANTLNFRTIPSVTKGYAYALFNLGNAENVSIRLYDVSGRSIREIYSGRLNRGEHRIPIETKNLASGTYFVKLETSQGSLLTKVIVTH